MGLLVQEQEVTSTGAWAYWYTKGYWCRGIELLVHGYGVTGTGTRVTGTRTWGYWCRGIGLLVEGQGSFA